MLSTPDTVPSAFSITSETSDSTRTGVDGDHHEVWRADVGQKVRLQVCDGHEAQQQDHDDRNKDGERLFDAEFFHDFLSISFLCRRAAKGTPQPRQHPLNASYHSYYTQGNPPCNSPEVNL